MIFRAEMNNARHWRIEVELPPRNVLEALPKTDEFPGKLEKHAPPFFAEFGATSLEVKLFSDSNCLASPILRQAEAWGVWSRQKVRAGAGGDKTMIQSAQLLPWQSCRPPALAHSSRLASSASAAKWRSN
jgi:hypothetical protein